MPLAEAKTITAAKTDRVLNANPDISDLRDRFYEPALLELKLSLAPEPLGDAEILDQFDEGACTGFALAAVINRQNKRRRLEQLAEPKSQVSPRMLYEMARIHDEWPGASEEGSSIRGAIKGFFHNGACRQEIAPYIRNEQGWTLTIDQAKDARNVGLGAYYRLRAEILDYHAALNEVGAIVVSAIVHSGWSHPKTGKIGKSSLTEGGHAFAIVGYDAKGFLVQNSWGPDWGGYNTMPGIGHWAYEDWAENVIDAWVLRLSVPTPDAFDLTHVPINKIKAQTSDTKEAFVRPAPRRQDVVGHVIHLDDGKLVETGRYGTSLQTISKTAELIRDSADSDTPVYKHLLLYAHGGLNSNAASGRRIHAMKGVFKRNGIYPVHFMWETGFTEELGDVLGQVFERSHKRVGFNRDGLDWAIEKFARGLGRRIWNQIKQDAALPFGAKGQGWRAVKQLLDANRTARHPLKVHFAGHSAGSILLAELMKSLPRMGHEALKIESCGLMAPACTLEFYDKFYRPALNAGGPLARLYQFNMVDKRERDDTVGPYGKSLLYLVSRAFEARPKEPLLGMTKHSDRLQLPDNHKIWYAGRNLSQTNSKSHGGFDNDRSTMNTLLATILSHKPGRNDAFQEHELMGY